MCPFLLVRPNEISSLTLSSLRPPAFFAWNNHGMGLRSRGSAFRFCVQTADPPLRKIELEAAPHSLEAERGMTVHAVVTGSVAKQSLRECHTPRPMEHSTHIPTQYVYRIGNARPV